MGERNNKSESDILATLYEELNLREWWHDLIGQTPDFANFDIDKAIASLPRTEVLAAEAVHLKFKNILTYTESRNRWFLWNGTIHTPCDGDGIAIKIAKLYYKAMADALEFIKDYYESQAKAVEAAQGQDWEKKAKALRQMYDKGETSKHKSFRDRMSTDAGLNALVRVMKTECDVPSDYYENDTRWFVMRNCVIDLHAWAMGERNLLKHSPDRPVTKYFDADWDRDANLGHWDMFLQRSIPNKAMREYLQVVTGAAFMGTSKLRAIMNLYGPPGSGKSVFLGTMFKLNKEGAGYACMPDSKAVIKVSGQNFEQDTMRGRRFIGISEPSANEPIDDDFLKKYTGDDWVETRTLNVKSTGWTPQGMIYVASNKPMRINTRDKAIVNRVQIIEFPVEFEEGEHVPESRRVVRGLEGLLMQDRSAVLEWVVVGMIKFIAEGMKLHPPEEVVAKRGDIVTEASTALRWVEDYVEEGLIVVDYSADDKYCIPIKDAYARYKTWAMMSGENKPLSLRFFSQDIENKFLGRVKDGNIARFKGLTVTVDYRRLYEANGVTAITTNM